MKARLATLFVLIGMLSACGAGESDGSIAISVIGSKPKVLNPNSGPLDPSSRYLIGAVAQGLVTFDARGGIEPALAESWIVTDDGLSYIFRVARTKWSDGRRTNAGDVAASLRALMATSSQNNLKPLLGAITEIVAMTDRVIEIRLSSPQPSLLQLLAQPEMAIMRGSRGTGPYRIYRSYPNSYVLRPNIPEGHTEEEYDPSILKASERRLRGESASVALARFKAGEIDMVLGGRIDTYPFVKAAGLTGDRVHGDPAIGLFGLMINRSSSILSDVDMRRAVAMAIDRKGITQRLAAKGWRPMETILPGPIDAVAANASPDWADLDFDDRIARARVIVADKGRRQALIRLAMPKGPGGRRLFAEIEANLRSIGLRAAHVAPGANADVRLLDTVAPYSGAIWFLAQFSCRNATICSEKADAALARARAADNLKERGEALATADRALADAQVYIPLASPLRWSIVSARLVAYQDNAVGIHPPNQLRVTSR